MSEINNNSTAEELNEVVEEVVDDATVMTVPIDDTLSISGEAADAKAVGDALANKIGRGEALTGVTVNGVQSDSSGNVNITGADIPMSSASGAATVGAAMDAMNQSLSEMEQEVETATEQAGAAVKTVNGVTPDENGNVELTDPGYVQTVTDQFTFSSDDGEIGTKVVNKCGPMVSIWLRLELTRTVRAGGTITINVSTDGSVMVPLVDTPGLASGDGSVTNVIITGRTITGKVGEDVHSGLYVYFFVTYMCLNR